MMHDKSRADEIFQLLRAEGHAGVDRLIEDRASEELFLDFKRSASNGEGNSLHNKDRRNLAKSICGFGNSEGGVILWGVECSNDAAGGDLPTQKLGIADPARFRAWLESAVSSCTIPPHTGVENLVIEPNEEAPGLVATHVPKLYEAPLQTVGDLRFLIRAGSSFVPMPHGMVASLFGRRPQPHCFPNYILSAAEVTPNGTIRLAFGVAVVNEGPGIAEDLYATVTFISLPGENTAADFETPDMQNWSGGTAFGRRISLASNKGFRLAPEGMSLPMTINVEFSPPFVDSLAIKVLAGASSSRPYSQTLGASAAEIQEVFDATLEMHADGQEFDGHDVASKLLGEPDSTRETEE